MGMRVTTEPIDRPETWWRAIMDVWQGIDRIDFSSPPLVALNSLPMPASGGAASSSTTTPQSRLDTNPSSKNSPTGSSAGGGWSASGSLATKSRATERTKETVDKVECDACLKVRPGVRITLASGKIVDLCDVCRAKPSVFAQRTWTSPSL